MNKKTQYLGIQHRKEKVKMSAPLPFKNGNVVKYEATGYCATIMNVLPNAIMVNQDCNGNSGMFKIEIDPDNVAAAGLKIIR
jgi:hypothetical protein